MRKIILLIVLLFLILPLGTGVLAQETELPDPGLTPDSPFYFLETIAEGIGTFFTFGDLKKAERHAALAVERLAEARAVVEKGKPEFAEKTLERYRMQLQNSIARAEKAQTKGENTEKVMAKVGKATSVHLEILAEVYEKVPEQAKPAIEKAMEASLKGHEKAVEVLKEKDALGEVPERVSLPEKVPQEVRERIQMRVQQELEVEKALEGFESHKSLRTLCTEAGGTPEICEKFPLESFESFEQIEAFCIEQGGTPELCASLEAKCKEVGVTAPDECFRVLMTATITTSPAPSLSEEEMEERRRREAESSPVPTWPEEEIEERRRVEEESTRTGYAFLGVQYQIIGKELQEARNLPVDYGVLLIGAGGEPAVIPGSPAALAGLKEDDIILEFNGERITKDNSLAEMMSRSKVGEVVNLKVLRGEEVIVINVELTEKPAN